VKKSFAPITKKVELKHADQTIELTLRPLPLGYFQLTSLWIPEPEEVKTGRFINGKEEVGPPSKQAVAERERVLNMCRLGHSLGDQIETMRPPDGAPLVEWHAYKDALWAEFAEAGFIEADIGKLMNGFYEVCAGIGDPKKASSPEAAAEPLLPPS
jgi:hypothetical protein